MSKAACVGPVTI